MGSICQNKRNEADHDLIREDETPGDFNYNNDYIKDNQDQNVTERFKSKNKYFNTNENLNQETNIQNTFGGEEYLKNNENEKNYFKNANNEENTYNNNNDINDQSEYLLKTINVNSQIQNKERIHNFQNDLLPSDDFSKYIFEQINELRKNPKAFVPLFESKKANIILDKKKRLIYKSKVRVALYKGVAMFDETIKCLEECEPMNELIFNPQMCIPLPENEEEIKSKNYMKDKVNEIIGKGISIKSFWKDYIKDPESSFVLMVVDDSDKKPGNKRKDLLNPNYKFIGISSKMINKSFVCYITLSDN